MSAENVQRLVECLNEITYRYAPERGVTAEYIALLLDIKGVKAPSRAAQKAVKA